MSSTRISYQISSELSDMNMSLHHYFELDAVYFGGVTVSDAQGSSPKRKTRGILGFCYGLLVWVFRVGFSYQPNTRKPHENGLLGNEQNNPADIQLLEANTSSRLYSIISLPTNKHSSIRGRQSNSCQMGRVRNTITVVSFNKK